MKKYLILTGLIVSGFIANSVSAATYSTTELLDKWVKCLEDAKNIKPTLWWLLSVIKTLDSCEDYSFAQVENTENTVSNRLTKIIEIYNDVLKSLKQQEYVTQLLYKYQFITPYEHTGILTALKSNRCSYLPKFMEKDVKYLFSVRNLYSKEQQNAITSFRKWACDNSHILQITPVKFTIQNLTFVKWLLDKMWWNIYSIWPSWIYQYSWGKPTMSQKVQKKIDELSKKK
jgi:hypothetical protein